VGIGFNIIGRKIGDEIKKFIQIIFEARKDDNRQALLYNSAGDDSVPLNEERIILVKVDGAGKYAAVGVLIPSQGAKPGEKIFFARNLDGRTVSRLSMLHDGHVDFTQDGDFIGNTEGNHELTIIGDSSTAVGGDRDDGVEGNRTENTSGNHEENVTGNAKYTSANTDIKSTAPIGLNDGLYITGLSPYLTAEAAAATALNAAAAAASAQLATLDADSGGAGTITALGQAITAFCTAMAAADTSAHTAIAKAVK
jgi:hypothetical protein